MSGRRKYTLAFRTQTVQCFCAEGDNKAVGTMILASSPKVEREAVAAPRSVATEEGASQRSWEGNKPMRHKAVPENAFPHPGRRGQIRIYTFNI